MQLHDDATNGDIDVGAFLNYFAAHYRPGITHMFRWWPEEPVLQDPRGLVVWCTCDWCSLESSHACHRVYQGIFFADPDPCNVRATEVVVRQYALPSGEDSMSLLSKTFRREIDAFQRVYPGELKACHDNYAFKGTKPMLFIATRRHGRDLQEALRDPEMSESKKLDLIRRVCHCVKHAHRELVHADLKPRNIVEAIPGNTVPSNFGGDESAVLLVNFEFTAITAHIPVPAASQSGYHSTWRSPVQRRLRRCAQKSDDCYSLALALYEIMHYREDPRREQQDGMRSDTPQFMIDLFDEQIELKQPSLRQPDEFQWFVLRYERRLLRVNDDVSLQITVPPIPKRCHPLLRSLMTRLFEYFASVPPSASPTVPFDFDQHLPSDSRSAGQHVALSTPRALKQGFDENDENEAGLKQLANFVSPRRAPYFESIPDSLRHAMEAVNQGYDAAAFVSSAQFALTDAIRLPPKPHRSPEVFLEETMSMAMISCGQLFADVQECLDRVRVQHVVTFNHRTQDIAVGKHHTCGTWPRRTCAGAIARGGYSCTQLSEL
eukprot:CAMPEP_0174846274 /NCGR_PEP_ID=MMETSP1114-20130205/12215_1 /TAXON_ID=312471 /ORGANISM="Neobodo designis, Strain CCAP 1951/1" /LENGTH=547 /DNA_ID=CAMNT_0016080537 /DNA_START=61 /DNA_END=1703 /DNA_ORIENTATION=-